jgi:2-amino-4-hydroxy-6-hydroxymethyldihydropteridine diphosphokinase
VRAVLSLGSNLGDRAALLAGAVAGLAAADGVEVVAVSPVYETEPVGGPEQGDYLNAVVVVETTLSPPALLALAQSLEAAAGRVRAERWGPRVLDVDVVDAGGESRCDPDLVLPHPRAGERAFVLVPWLAADPDATLGRTVRVADLLGGVDTTGVRLRPDVVLGVPA